jgi:hypothetical protein
MNFTINQVCISKKKPYHSLVAWPGVALVHMLNYYYLFSMAYLEDSAVRVGGE